MMFVIQTAMISLEGLQKHIDPSQLDTDLNGTLQFDHNDWLTSRMVSITGSMYYSRSWELPAVRIVQYV